jgi:ribonuclease R
MIIYLKNNEIRTSILALVGAGDYKPLKIGELASALKVPRAKRPVFFKTVRELERDGAIVFSRAKRIKPVQQRASATAKILSVTKNGAYAAADDGSGDIFIPRDRLRDAMPGDTAQVRIIDRGGRLPTAEVLRVSERGFVKFTGTVVKRGKVAFILPDGGYKDRIDLLGHDAGDARDREKVLAQMKTYPGKTTPGTAKVVSCYGPADRAASCCEALLDDREIRRDFPDAVKKEAAAARYDAAECAGRLDLRDEPIFTIDGAHTKDIDDAVSVKKTGDGFELGVHIADVSHYVTEGSALDKEAYERGTSIYFADTVIPMLPKELSNGVCSLNPGEDRLAFSAIMTIDKSGATTGMTLKKSVIRSRVKGVYDEVNALFDSSGDDALKKKYAEVLPEFDTMRALADILAAAREKRGAIDFESGDREIILDENGIASDVRRKGRGEAEMMIESFMLCANEAVAKFARERKLPFVYRVHESPDSERLETLAAAMKAAGIAADKLRPGLTPGDLAAAMKNAKDLPRAKMLSDLALRTMAKARYSPECLGHFGLALEDYCHFTSPIRRYPDLSIHRILTDALAGGNTAERYTLFAAQSSEQSSKREIVAMQVEWDCDDIYIAEYMTRHIGESFEGTVSSVKQFGMYVELDNSVEGLVRIDKLPGWFEYNEAALTLSCPKSGMSFTVGDRVKVIAARADVSSGQIDFELL